MEHLNTKLAPILTFPDGDDEPNDSINDKQPLVDGLPKPNQIKTMISRSCMTSREASDLENHLTASNNIEISFQGYQFVYSRFNPIVG